MSAKRMHLLSAGKSLLGSQDLGKQYQMSELGALPKFGSKKKKFQTPTSNSQTSSKPQAPNQTEIVGGAKKPGLMTRWASRVKGLVGGRKGAAKSAVPRFPREPVQGELSLDNVKVLRNDLSDTDFEVVARPAPKKAVPVQTAAPVAPTESVAKPAKIWNRVTTLLGAGQS